MTGLLVAFLAAALVRIAAAETLTGRVVAVADGDTVTVLDETNTRYKIRMAGIDAPERRQPYGRVSRQHLANTISTKTVQVQWTKCDRYGRIVGQVIADGSDLCLAQIASGLAWHYKKYEREQPVADRKVYAYAELRAREQKRGLWTNAHPVPPWEWRRP